MDEGIYGHRIHKCPFVKFQEKGEKKMTKTVLIVAAAAVFLVYGFVLWCCIKVGAESEKEYMKLAEKRGKEQQCDK
mgnify:CR=1 FL=1